MVTDLMKAYPRIAELAERERRSRSRKCLERHGALTCLIRRLEEEWRGVPRQAGLFLMYAFKGDVGAGSDVIAAHILIAYDTWSGAVWTRADKAGAVGEGAAFFMKEVWKRYPLEYRILIQDARLPSMPTRFSLRTLIHGQADAGGQSRQEIIEFIDDNLRTIDLGLISFGNIDKLHLVRAELMEWQQIHNCESERSEKFETKPSFPNAKITESVSYLDSGVTLQFALENDGILALLTRETDRLTPARRIWTAIVFDTGGDGKESMKLEDVVKCLHTSKKSRGTRIDWPESGGKINKLLVGKALKYLRLSHGDDERDAAKKLGIAKSQVKRYENNLESLSGVMLQKILSSYGCDIGEFSNIISMDEECASCAADFIKYLDDEDSHGD